MLIVSGTLTFDPAKAERFHEVAATLVEATLAEPGCITYGFWSDPANPGRVRAYEEWESAEALGEHMGTPHMAAFMGAMGEVGVTGSELTQHEVAESTKLM
jgi:quinol monooxygenase YgiN